MGLGSHFAELTSSRAKEGHPSAAITAQRTYAVHSYKGDSVASLK